MRALPADSVAYFDATVLGKIAAELGDAKGFTFAAVSVAGFCNVVAASAHWVFLNSAHFSPLSAPAVFAALNLSWHWVVVIA